MVRKLTAANCLFCTMLPHFPFVGTFNLGMGIRPLAAPDFLIEVDTHYHKEVALKRELLSEDPAYCFQAQDTSELAQWEVLRLVLESLTLNYPTFFYLEKEDTQWTWQNYLLQEDQAFVFGKKETLPFAPLDWVGRHIQEDLLVLDPSSVLVAGQLCFPSGWSLEEKMGKSFLDMHAPLPNVLNPMLNKAEQLMQRILPDKPLQRTNWGLRVTGELDLSTRHAEEYAEMLSVLASELTKDIILDALYLRIEYQTFTRLPLSNHVLFTVHTYLHSMADVAKDKAQARAMYEFLKTVPKDVLEYKQVLPFYEELIAALEEIQ